MSTIAEAEGFDMLRWRESSRKSCYEAKDVKVINKIAEEFVDMVRYLDGKVNDTLQWVEEHLPVDKETLASKRWMCKFHQMDMEELSVEEKSIVAARQRAARLFLVVGYMASALKDIEELRASAEKSLKEKELASKRWTYEVYIMSMAMFAVAFFVAVRDRASKLISLVGHRTSSTLKDPSNAASGHPEDPVSKATEEMLKTREYGKLHDELSTAKKLIIALTLELNDKQKALDACLLRESELRQRESELRQREARNKKHKRRKGNLARKVATTARGSRGERAESDDDTTGGSDIDTTRCRSSPANIRLDDLDAAGSEVGTQPKVGGKENALEASLKRESALQLKIGKLETKLRSTANKRNKRRKGDLARRVANTVGGFRVERAESDKVPSSSAEVGPANLDPFAPEAKSQVEEKQPDGSVMGCASGVPSASATIQHGFLRDMGRIGASALGSRRLPRVLIWDAILQEQERRRCDGSTGGGDNADGKSGVETDVLLQHNRHEHIRREGTVHGVLD